MAPQGQEILITIQGDGMTVTSDKATSIGQQRAQFHPVTVIVPRQYIMDGGD